MQRVTSMLSATCYPSQEQHKTENEGVTSDVLWSPSSRLGLFQDSYKQVYNWQFVHSIDFWCLILAKACSKEAEIQTGKVSEMKPLIYPLVQVALGAIKSVF